jgi:predicted ABC-type ATPase
MPRLILLGGPNGAGKTTAAMRILPGFLSLREYVNADTIAAGISAFVPESVAVEAGRVMLRRLHELAEMGADFAFETTLASRSFARFLRNLQGNGYDVQVVFLWLRSADLAVERVHTRVQAGGHEIPQQVVRRRYAAGWRNFLELYQPIADSWQVYDNSGMEERLVAEGWSGEKTEVHDLELWSFIEEGPTKP